MKEKFAISLDTGKKKGIAIVLATGLVLSFGTLTAFGASNWESLQESVLVTTDDDGTKYSTDGGQTWSSEVPDGTEVSVGEDGEEIVITGTPPEGDIDDVQDATNAANEAVSGTVIGAGMEHESIVNKDMRKYHLCHISEPPMT